MCALVLALASMSTFFYNATRRIPLGIAVTVEVLGPLVLSVAAGHSKAAWIRALLAFAGVAAGALRAIHRANQPGRRVVRRVRRCSLGALHHRLRAAGLTAEPPHTRKVTSWPNP